jgi:hypothetical protein
LMTVGSFSSIASSNLLLGYYWCSSDFSCSI